MEEGMKLGKHSLNKRGLSVPPDSYTRPSEKEKRFYLTIVKPIWEGNYSDWKTKI